MKLYRDYNIICFQFVIVLSVCLHGACRVQANPNEAIQEVLAELSEHRTWTTKFGDQIYGKPVRISDEKIYLNSNNENVWIAIPFLVDSEQLLIHEFQKKVEAIRGAARPLTGAEFVEQYRDADEVVVEKGPSEQELRVWTDQNEKTMKARLTSIDRFEVHLDFEGRHTRVPTWALSTFDLEYLQEVSGVDQSLPFPAALDPSIPSSRLTSLDEDRWRFRIGQIIRGALAGPKALDDATRWLSNIADEAAAKPLIRVCTDDRKPLPLRVAALESLCRIDLPIVPPILAELATTSNARSLSTAAKLGLKSLPSQADALHAFDQLLKSERTRGAANEVILDLGLLKPYASDDPYEIRYRRDPEFLNTLIGALFQNHTFKKRVVVGYDTGRVPKANGGWHRRANGYTKNVSTRLRTPQPQIYETLKQYTGEDFGYDQKAWYRWAKSEPR